ncbi:MAG: HAMP domain-containing protein [Sphingomonadales bacterium]|nr:HAMP domain-containing protein [Sphingomonadales bacterium]
MTSFSTRLTVFYALSFILASVGMLTLGYRQIDQKLMHGLDRLLLTERGRVFAHLALGPPGNTPADLGAKLRRSTDNSAVLFRVEIKSRDGASLFRSSNLSQPLPWSPPSPQFTDDTLSDGARVRIGRFDRGDLVIMVATPADNVASAMRGYVETSIGLLLAMAAFGIAVGYALSQVVLKPLREIADTAARISASNLEERIPVQRGDEVGDLARLLNAMLDRIGSSFRQIRQFTADASHELKTPLSLVRLHAEMILADPGLTTSQENAVVAQLEEVDRLSALVGDLLVLARADSNSMNLAIASHDPADFLERMRADVEVLAEAAKVRVRFIREGDGLVSFDPRWMRHIVLNLLNNAFRASPVGGTVTIASRLDAAGWQLAVEDEGAGVPHELLSRIFDRFVSDAPGGTGLGLTISRSIVELHGGTIVAMPGRDGRGLRVELALPPAAT